MVKFCFSLNCNKTRCLEPATLLALASRRVYYTASQSACVWVSNLAYLTLKAPSKIAADDILIFYFYLSKEIRLDFSCESYARQRIHLKHQVLFSLKNNEKIIMNVVCCSHDWRLKG